MGKSLQRPVITLGLVCPEGDDSPALNERIAQIWKSVAEALADKSVEQAAGGSAAPVLLPGDYEVPSSLSSRVVQTLSSRLRVWEFPGDATPEKIQAARDSLSHLLQPLATEGVALSACVYPSENDRDLTAAIGKTLNAAQKMLDEYSAEARGDVRFIDGPALTELYVGNLPTEASEQQVNELFTQHGLVTEVKLITDRDSGQGRGFGFVEMDRPDAEVAINALDGVEFQGRKLKVSIRRPRGPGGGSGRASADHTPPMQDMGGNFATHSSGRTEDDVFASYDGSWLDDDDSDEMADDLQEEEGAEPEEEFEDAPAAESAPADADAEESAPEPKATMYLSPPAVAFSQPEAAPPADPPRSAYARVEALAEVVVETTFALTVGLAKSPTPGVASGQIKRPPSSVGPYTMDIQILANGLEPVDGAALQHSLRITAEAPYPSVELSLRALKDAELADQRSIQVIYKIEGDVVGVAVRSLRVVERADQLGPPSDEPTSEGHLSIPTTDEPPDLTVIIAPGAAHVPGSLQWTWASPHENAPAAPDDLTSSVGEQLNDYAMGLIRGVATHEADASLRAYLKGIGKRVARKIPQEVMNMIEGACAEADSEGREASILLLTSEPHVPWELALLSKPPNPSAEAFLGAQANVGRWIFSGLKPPTPPLGPLPDASLAVVSGDYSQVAGWNRLKEAEQEAKDLAQTYQGKELDATESAVLSLLQGTPACSLLHFAMHGAYDPGGVRDGLVLADGKFLDPVVVEGSELAQNPFVYLNACQASGGQHVLGQYAGMAAAFLYAGACAVVSPLWSVGDGVAREIATRFYGEGMQGARPAAMLREERARFGPASTNATHLAYQFFGHPNFRLAERSADTTAADVDEP